MSELPPAYAEVKLKTDKIPLCMVLCPLTRPTASPRVEQLSKLYLVLETLSSRDGCFVTTKATAQQSSVI